MFGKLYIPCKCSFGERCPLINSRENPTKSKDEQWLRKH
jgi:hypothetical protein